MITNSYNKFTDIGVDGEALVPAMTSDLGHKNQGQERVPIQHLNIMDIIVRMMDHPIQTHTIVVSNSISHLHLSSGMNSVVKVIELSLKLYFVKLQVAGFIQYQVMNAQTKGTLVSAIGTCSIMSFVKLIKNYLMATQILTIIIVVFMICSDA